jgi:hypothetical protein
MTDTTSIKPISPAQKARIETLISKNIIHCDIPSTSWEASCIIRNSPASKRDKDELGNLGGRVLARMTSSEVEMTIKVVQALAAIDAAGVKNAKVLEAASELRKMFGRNKQQ